MKLKNGQWRTFIFRQLSSVKLNEFVTCPPQIRNFSRRHCGLLSGGSAAWRSRYNPKPYLSWTLLVKAALIHKKPRRCRLEALGTRRVWHLAAISPVLEGL